MSNIIQFPKASKYDYPVNKALETTKKVLFDSGCSSDLIEKVINKIKPEAEEIMTNIFDSGVKEIELKGVSGLTEEHTQQIYGMFHPQIRAAICAVNLLLAREAIRDIVDSKK